MGNKAMSEPKPPLKDGKLPEPLWCAEKSELVPGEAIFLAAGCAEWIGTLEPAGGLWDY